MPRKYLIAIALFIAACAVLLVVRRDDASAPSAVEADAEAARERSRRASRLGGGGDDVRDDSPAAMEARRIARERARRERFAAQIELVSLGPSPVTLTPDAIMAAMDDSDAAFEDCIEAAGGRDAYRAAMREQRRAQQALRAGDQPRPEALAERIREQRLAARGQRTSDRALRFEVRPDGSIDRESIELEPQVPAPFAACFIERLSSLALGPVGPDGVSVEMPMRGPMRRSSDGGVPMPR